MNEGQQTANQPVALGCDRLCSCGASAVMDFNMPLRASIRLLSLAQHALLRSRVRQGCQPPD